jgi:hypothetical protein
LRWLVDGYRAWQEIGLEPPEKVRTRTARYRSDQDHLGAFLEQRCDTTDPRASIPVKDLRSAYETWCEEAQHEPLTKTVWGRSLSERGTRIRSPQPASPNRAQTRQGDVAVTSLRRSWLSFPKLAQRVRVWGLMDNCADCAWPLFHKGLLHGEQGAGAPQIGHRGAW